MHSVGLTAVLFNPPLSSGARTVTRVELAAKLLGHTEVTIANLFPLPTQSVLDVNTAGKDFSLWQAARVCLVECTADGRDVLLAYGCQEPVGEVRAHFRAQLAWLNDVLAHTGNRLWMVSDQPRHPSRWQRYTSRSYPGMQFENALKLSLRQVPAGSHQA